MSTEYMLGPDDTHESLARDLLEQAADPDQVHWSPRPDVPGGGVFTLADSAIAERVRAVRQDRRDEEDHRISASLAAANERDSHEDVASGLLTPAEAGFAANAGIDPGSAGAAEENAEATDDAEAEAVEEPVEDDPATPEEDESKLTPAQKRTAAKKAKVEAEQAAADQEKSE